MGGCAGFLGSVSKGSVSLGLMEVSLSSSSARGVNLLEGGWERSESSVRGVSLVKGSGACLTLIPDVQAMWLELIKHV